MGSFVLFIVGLLLGGFVGILLSNLNLEDKDDLIYLYKELNRFYNNQISILNDIIETQNGMIKWGVFMYKKYEEKITQFLEVDPVCIEYEKKKEKGQLTNSDKLQFVKYLSQKTLELTAMVDKGLL